MRNDIKACLFFAPLRTKDVTSRKNFLEELEKEFEPRDCRQNGNQNHNTKADENLEDHSTKYSHLLRLEHECPFSEVRESCGTILKRLEDEGIRVPKRKYTGPSKFISLKDCVSIDTKDNDVHSLFVEAFLANGRTSHINQLLGYHVQYLSCFLDFETALMNSNGPLHMDWRFYIGIMGASRHQCLILIEECEANFLMMGGNPQWLEGIDHVPLKLQKLNNLNMVLAHQPWLLSEDIIKDLLTGPAAETWTMSELIHAVIILTHFQTLSGFVFGCGITPEIDSRKGHSRRSPSSGEYGSGSEPVTPTKLRAASFGSKTPEETGTSAQLFKKIQIVKEEEENEEDNEQEEEEKLRQFQEVETKECKVDSLGKHLIST